MKHLALRPSRRALFFSLVLTAASAALLSACGGGGGGGDAPAPAPAPATPMAALNVGFTDAPSADFQNLWVTISEIAFHWDDGATPDDPKWLKYPLASPVTVNLAALNNGNFQDVFQNIMLPVGTYKQVRLKLVDDDAALTASATAAGLTYNDQVDYLDSAGNLQRAPLELIGPRQGITVFGTFTIAQNITNHLVFDFDLESDVVRYPDVMSGGAAFTLKPHSLRYFDMNNVGAITGTIDPAQLLLQNANGAYEVIVKAEEVSADGSKHVVTRATRADPTTGKFALFPLNVPTGAAGPKVDVLVRGRNMNTLIVKGVPVVAGTSPTSNPTQIANGVLPVNLGTEYTVNLSSAASPTGSWINFDQTLSGAGEIPYEVRFRHVNPFTGLIENPFALSTGAIYSGNYIVNSNPTFTAVSPVAANGSFSAVAKAIQYSATTAVPVTGTAGNLTSIALPGLAIDSSAAAAAGTITANVTTSTPGRFDKAQLVIARYGEIVTTVAVDPAILSGNGGAVVVSNLPAGTTAAPDKAAFYYGYIRAWKTTTPNLRPRVIPILAFADFRAQNTATVNVTLP